MAYTTIKKPSDYFNTITYTGNGNDARGITGVGFQPDFVWSKNRDNGTRYHALTNVISGATKFLSSNATSAEQTDSTTYQSFDSDGFTVGTNANTNENGSGIVSWNWLANGAGSANTDGSISSTVSVNTTSGFSIVSYTGTEANATVGHGLGVAPKMIIVKRLNGTTDWAVGHQEADTSNPWNKYLQLNDPTAPLDRAVFNDTAPTNSVFSVGADILTNASAAPMIAYCFAEKQGYSKFGSYVGNGNADGTFVYTGFSPAFVMIKETNGSGAWRIYDSKRGQGGDNIGGNYKNAIIANTSAVEESATTDNLIDSLSNGFKCRSIYNDTNGSGGTYIYIAFAEEPLVGDNPCTAR
jgi:hypothetical protein